MLGNSISFLTRDVKLKKTLLIAVLFTTFLVKYEIYLFKLIFILRIVNITF